MEVEKQPSDQGQEESKVAPPNPNESPKQQIDASEQNEDKEEADVSTKIAPKPTLYVKNLNDKIKMQGKLRLDFTEPLTCVHCRNEDKSLLALFHVWRSDSGENA